MMDGVSWEWSWGGLALFLAVVFLIVLGVAYAWTPVRGWRRGALAGLKAAAVTLLLACLLNPSKQVIEPKPGENLLLFAVDQSLSLDLKDDSSEALRRDQISELLGESQRWLDRLEEDYQVQFYGVGEQLRPVQRAEADLGQDVLSELFGQTSQLLERYRDQPVAGVVVLTDGLATDSLASTSLAGQPPVFPVLLGGERPPIDLSLEEVTANPTNFETTPLIITTKLQQVGLDGAQVSVAVLAEDATELVRETVLLSGNDGTVLNLEVPQFKGPLARYRVVARLTDEVGPLGPLPLDSTSQEVTLLNNHKRIIVQREGGPFRMLYVAGRPNWEFKFLRRAAQVDSEIKLVGLLRLAVKEPRFAFLDRTMDSRNPLFDGFNSIDPEEVAEYSEPVLVRLGTLTDDELADGFPKSAGELFEYSAIILDDVNVDFFSQDQLDLLKLFVDRRGGGLLMLGGPQAFDQGGFDRSSLADVLPVYSETRPRPGSESFRWQLTREGWLEPWTRLRETQDAETQVRAEMPGFYSINQVARIKPGAQLLGTLETPQLALPGLATQPYGRGRSAALMVGDLFRWKLQTPADNPLVKAKEPAAEPPHKDDFGQAWRQLLRWMVADLPQRVAASSRAKAGSTPSREIMIDVRNREFLPDDTADVKIVITYPNGEQVTESARWTLTEGQYQGEVVLNGEGYYQVECVAVDRDGQPIGTALTGWTWEPTGDEYRGLILERAPWQEWADKSAGKITGAVRTENAGQPSQYGSVASEADPTKADLAPMADSVRGGRPIGSGMGLAPLAGAGLTSLGPADSQAKSNSLLRERLPLEEPERLEFGLERFFLSGAQIGQR